MQSLSLVQPNCVNMTGDIGSVLLLVEGASGKDPPHVFAPARLAIGEKPETIPTGLMHKGIIIARHRRHCGYQTVNGEPSSSMLTDEWKGVTDDDGGWIT